MAKAYYDIYRVNVTYPDGESTVEKFTVWFDKVNNCWHAAFATPQQIEDLGIANTENGTLCFDTKETAIKYMSNPALYVRPINVSALFDNDDETF
jgi:hypothetical protein